jgi:hypothetical protein
MESLLQGVLSVLTHEGRGRFGEVFYQSVHSPVHVIKLSAHIQFYENTRNTYTNNGHPTSQLFKHGAR